MPKHWWNYLYFEANFSFSLGLVFYPHRLTLCVELVRIIKKYAFGKTGACETPWMSLSRAKSLAIGKRKTESLLKKNIIVKKQRNLYVMILYLIPELMLCWSVRKLPMRELRELHLREPFSPTVGVITQQSCGNSQWDNWDVSESTATFRPLVMIQSFRHDTTDLQSII